MKTSLLKVLLAASLAVLASLFLPAASAQTAAKDKIAVVVSTLNNPWFVVLGETAKARAVELGYEATIFDSQNDTAKEAANFENIIAGGYQAILFNPTDANGSIASVLKAKAAGIPVFCIDREINATNAATSQMLSDSGEFDRAKGLEVMESILQAHPNIKAVFCGNDAMAMGAYQALVTANKADVVKVFGFDGADDVVKLIAEGKIAATGMQFPKLMARQAAEYADSYVKGKRDFAQKIPVPVELVTQQNVSKYGDYGKK